MSTTNNIRPASTVGLSLSDGNALLRDFVGTSNTANGNGNTGGNTSNTPARNASFNVASTPALNGNTAAATSPAPSQTQATTATATPAAQPSISLDSDSGSTPVTVTTRQAVGAANASNDAATNASAKRSLDGVDALNAQQLGASYKAPATQQERVAQVAQVANSLKGAERTAYLNKVAEFGRPFGLNFGQPSIVASTANLTADQKQIQAALYTEFVTGKPFSKDVQTTTAGTTAAATSASAPATTASSTASSASTGSGVPADATLHEDSKEVLARVTTETREQTRARVASWDTNGNGRIDQLELASAVGPFARNWDNKGNTLDRQSNRVDAIADELRRRAGV
jgi:hypothetical protein